MSGDRPRAEFDAFAPGYDAGMSDPLKRLSGCDAATFIEHKADWLLRHVATTGRVLDFGCGTGGLLRALQRRGHPLDLVGCDISAGMIESGRAQWDVGPLPPLHVVSPGRLPFADAEFDLVTAMCVLHHIDPAERPEVVHEILRVTKPGGAVAVFEHNPRNPVTRWLVRRAPIDANAVLLDAAECTQLLLQAGAGHCQTDYILFFPPRFRRLWAAERFLSRLPLGGQYVTLGTRRP